MRERKSLPAQISEGFHKQESKNLLNYRIVFKGKETVFPIITKLQAKILTPLLATSREVPISRSSWAKLVYGEKVDKRTGENSLGANLISFSKLINKQNLVLIHAPLKGEGIGRRGFGKKVLSYLDFVQDQKAIHSEGEIFERKKKQIRLRTRDEIVETLPVTQVAEAKQINTPLKEEVDNIGLTDHEIYIITRKLLVVESNNKKLLDELHLNINLLKCEEISGLAKSVGYIIGNNRGISLPDFEETNYLSAISKLRKINSCKDIPQGSAGILASCFKEAEITESFWDKLFEGVKVFAGKPMRELRQF